MISIDQILDDIKGYNPNTNIENIRAAYDFSAMAHEGQTRKSGEPYLIHPLEVAKIMVQLRMDDASIMAAILHDTIEDTSVTKEDIEKRFGQDVAHIVDGVTKISKIKFTNQQERQAENYRKMILAMSKDIRVIMVKLADRLNNMRTLQFMPEVKQVNISQETLDIYAPIAGRMGIYWVKEELEELSFKFYKPQMYQDINSRLHRLQKKRESYMLKVTEALTQQIRAAEPYFEISGRLKKPYSIYRKMQRQEIALDDVHDLLAFRVLVNSIEQCYEVLGHVHSLWKPIQGRFKDYIAMPKANFYQSLHTTVMCFEGERVEFQVRTKQMHEIAEKGIAAHWKYKTDGGLDTRDEAKFSWLRQLADWQNEITDSLEFVHTVKLDLFEDEIFVFTPKGDLKSLSHDSTPVDFAYAIHSAVGNHCSGARVNGKMVPLSYRLESGDAVEIITDKNRQPNKDWLDFVTTSKAKTHIRQHIRQEQRLKSLTIGRNLFESTCQKLRLNPSQILKSDEFKKILEIRKVADVEDFYTSLAYGKFQARDVLDPFVKTDETAVEEENQPGGVIKKIFEKVAGKNKNLILVDQQDGMLVTFGKCCSPVKGDPITGYVSRGRGVAVHRTECARMLSIDPERRVSVAWNDVAQQDSLARILIIAEDRKGILAEVTQTISEKNVNISKVLVKSERDGVARISFDLSVCDTNELRRVMTAIENLKHIVRVVRQ